MVILINKVFEFLINKVKNCIEQKYCQNQSLEFASFKKKVDNNPQKHASLKKMLYHS